MKVRRDGTYRATAHHQLGVQTTHGRFTVLAGSESASEFEWPSAGGETPLTKRLTVTRHGDRLVLQDQGEQMVLTKR